MKKRHILQHLTAELLGRPAYPRLFQSAAGTNGSAAETGDAAFPGHSMRIAVKTVNLPGTDLNAAAAPHALRYVVHQLRAGLISLRIVTPVAMKFASFQERNCANFRAVHGGKPFHIKNLSRAIHCSLHLMSLF